MPAILTIDQAGLSPGVPGVARDDGLATGALVTLTNTGGGSTLHVNLLWVPPEDTTSLASLAQTSPSTFTYSPTAATYGRHRIEMIVDQSLSTESRTVHTFGIPLPVSGLVIPAANELSDPSTTLQNQADAARRAASESNAPFGPFTGSSPWGWWKAIRDLYVKVESLVAGGARERSFSGIVVADSPTEISYSDALASLTTPPGDQFTVGMNDTLVRLDYPVTQSFTMRSLYVQPLLNAFAVHPTAFTVWKNGSATALTVNVPAGSTAQVHVDANVSFVVTDRYAFVATHPGGEDPEAPLFFSAAVRIT